MNTIALPPDQTPKILDFDQAIEFVIEEDTKDWTDCFEEKSDFGIVCVKLYAKIYGKTETNIEDALESKAFELKQIADEEDALEQLAIDRANYEDDHSNHD